jgi:hypothetical protein
MPHQPQKRFFISKKSSILLLGLFLADCLRASTGAPLPAASPPSPVQLGMDFAALIGDQGSIVHIDAQGKTSVTPIDFLQGEKIVNWDMATLDQIVTIGAAIGSNGSPQTIEIKYFKNKKLAQSFRLEKISSIAWMMIVPEKNCLILSAEKSTPVNTHTVSIIRIDLTSGERKELGGLSNSPYIPCKPIWDKAKGNLIVAVTAKLPPPTMQDFNLLARMDPIDLSIKDYDAIDNFQLDGLISYDSASNQVTCYGIAGDKTYSGQPTPGFYTIALDSATPTLLLKDTMPGTFASRFHNEMAGVAGQYVLMTRPDGGGPTSTPCSYCVDLKSLSWKTLPDITPFTWPISQEGLGVEAQPPSPQSTRPNVDIVPESNTQTELVAPK